MGNDVPCYSFFEMIERESAVLSLCDFSFVSTVTTQQKTGVFPESSSCANITPKGQSRPCVLHYRYDYCNDSLDALAES
jgi:hypothetical protein